MRVAMTKSIIFKCVLLLFSIIAVLLYWQLRSNTGNTLKINEIAFSHADGVDWIEIYNPTLHNLSLEGLYLSDSAKNFTKFEIKDQVIVPRHGFAIIYCEGYEGDLQNSVVTNFRISNGETIYLIGSNGSSVLDSMTAISDNQSSEITIGRFPDGNNELFLMSTPTPGAENQKDFLNLPEAQ